MSEDQKPEKSFILFGRDVSKIPCFRNSLVYGIEGGLFCGLVRFLFTSHVHKSVNFAVYSCAFITLGYWTQCRYNYSKTKFEMLKLQHMLQTRAMKEGTEEITVMEDEFKKQSVDV